MMEFRHSIRYDWVKELIYDTVLCAYLSKIWCYTMLDFQLYHSLLSEEGFSMKFLLPHLPISQLFGSYNVDKKILKRRTSLISLWVDEVIILLADILCRRSPNSVALYTLTSVCIFSILFPIHFLRCWQGEFVYQSRASLLGDHFLFSHVLDVWFKGDIVRRN